MADEPIVLNDKPVTVDVVVKKHVSPYLVPGLPDYRKYPDGDTAGVFQWIDLDTVIGLKGPIVSPIGTDRYLLRLANGDLVPVIVPIEDLLRDVKCRTIFPQDG